MNTIRATLNGSIGLKHLLTFITALLGAELFRLLGLPIPWLLGPMLGTLAGSSFFKQSYAWSPKIRNAGMILVGYVIGLSMTLTALRSMSHQLPYMLLMTFLLLLMCSGFAWLIAKISGLDFLTLLMGSVPGGLTQVLALAEETEGTDMTIVTVNQVVRLMMIVICIPLLIFSPLFGNHHEEAGSAGAASSAAAEQITQTAAPLPQAGFSVDLLLFLAVCVIAALIGNKIKFPTAFLLGPALSAAVLQMIWGPGPALPHVWTNAAQLMIGAYVGLLLKPAQLQKKVQTIGYALLNGLLLLLGSIVLSLILKGLQSFSISTALLSMAPGGMDQMSIIAQEIHADLSTVAGFQLFRTFFIFFAVPPLFRLLIGRIKADRDKKQLQADE